MNKEIYSNSKKFLILLIVICVVFFIVVAKAFEYLPDSEANKSVIKHADIEDINKPRAIEENNSQPEEEEASAKQEDLNVTLNVQDEAPEINNNETPAAVSSKEPGMPEPTESMEIISDTNGEPIAEPAAPALTQEEQTELSFANAKKYKEQKQYVKALEEYKKILASSPDTNTRARCYEEIANVYAIVKRYGSALSYAQKAYNLAPSSSREVLLARLYYKTGDIDKATTRINNVLQRDFSSDRN